MIGIQPPEFFVKDPVQFEPSRHEVGHPSPNDLIPFPDNGAVRIDRSGGPSMTARV